MQELERAGAVIHEIPMVRELRPRTDRRHVRALTELIRDVRPAIVHTHSSKAGALGRRAAQAAGVSAVVHTPHTYSFLFGEMFGPIQRWVFRGVERRLSRLARRVVAVSADEAQTMCAAGVVEPEQVRVVPNGMDPGANAAASAAAAPVGSVEGRARVLVCGLLNPAKGQDLAIGALGSADCEGVELWIAGDGEQRGVLEALVRAVGVEGRVLFLGQREDVPELMKAADCLLLPSRWEGMPYVLLEAAAAGLPIVATPVDGAREFLGAEEGGGERGWLAEASTEEAIGAALGAAIAAGSPERERRAANARRWVLDHHAVERMMDALEAVYAELL
jgi:glycosyltransferase involved in cell wall biosynthesis